MRRVATTAVRAFATSSKVYPGTSVLSKAIYTAKATATGGRDGRATTSDGVWVGVAML
jgi:hypothetical protein